MSSPRQYATDSSYHETSFGGYANLGTHLHVSEGTINLIQSHPRAYDQYSPSNPLQILREHCSPRATFDSADRFDPPQCAEATRIEIIQRIEQWVNDEGSNTSPANLFWLYGGAGVGKSAIAQTLSEKLHWEQRLGASFFFFRTDASRNTGNALIPTLIAQLVSTFEGLGPFVEERIHANPDLFRKRYETQIEQLLTKPLLRLKSTDGSSFLPRPGPTSGLRSWPRLIVIDGLDECQNPDVQCNLLRAIANAIPRIPYPLRFLVTSRPEKHIVRLFNHDRTIQTVTFDRYNLSDDPDADMDIRKFLEKEFDEICCSHCLSQYLPPAWPDNNSITSIVERSSGHFIYAATVIRYIRSDQHRPDDRLEVILRLQPPQGQDQPYIQLDALYSLIFQDIETHDKLERVCLVLGILYLRDYTVRTKIASYSDCSTIEAILGMRAGDIILLLSPIFSLVVISNEEVRILHKSLIDYLVDPTRSGHLGIPFDPRRVHELAATYILRERIMANCCTPSEFANFAYHCQYGYLNHDLKDYLRDLEVPYPKCLKTLEVDLPAIIAHFFRALSRDDFDSTGEYHGQYAAKWMRFLHFPESYEHQRSISSASSKATTADSHNLKNRLDTMLKQRNSKKFKPTDLDGTIPVRHAGIIQREHLVWSALTRYECSTSSWQPDVVSSLSSGDDFTYSYHLITQTEETMDSSFLCVAIYASHRNACVINYYGKLWDSDLDRVMRDGLEVADGEEILLSDSFRKYGILPDGVYPLGWRYSVHQA